jgi:hypothetical protein
LHYSARPLKDGAKGPKPVELGRFGTASVFVDNASAGLCFGFIVDPSSWGYTGATCNGPDSVTVSVNAPYDDPE